MATLAFQRIAQVNHLTRCLGPLVMRHACPLAATPSISQNKVLAVTQSRGARRYEPVELGGKPAIMHWKTMRWSTGALIPIIPLAFMFPSTALDLTVSAAVVLHAHWGLEGVMSDYVHDEYLIPAAKPTLILLSITAFGGLCYLNYNDVGIVKAVIMFFSEL